MGKPLTINLILIIIVSVFAANSIQNGAVAAAWISVAILWVLAAAAIQQHNVADRKAKRSK